MRSFIMDVYSYYGVIYLVVVAGDHKQRSGIILAACPVAKTYGVKAAEPLWKARAKCSTLHMVKPRMGLYIDISM